MKITKFINILFNIPNFNFRSLVTEQKHREKSRHDQYINDYKAECVVKTFPKTREDFNVLYVQIQAWKDNEVISKTLKILSYLSNY